MGGKKRIKHATMLNIPQHMKRDRKHKLLDLITSKAFSEKYVINKVQR